MSLRAAVVVLLSTACYASDCLPIEQAPKHIGQMQCVTGKIESVNESKSVWYLDFCQDYKNCPFSVVVFKKDLKDSELLKSFQGKIMRIYGPIEDYHGRTQMVLKLEQQLTGEAGTYAEALRPHQKAGKMAPMPRGSGLGRR